MQYVQYFWMPKLLNVSNRATRTVTKLSVIQALSRVWSGIYVVPPKILGHWDMFWTCKMVFGMKTVQKHRLLNTWYFHKLLSATNCTWISPTDLPRFHPSWCRTGWAPNNSLKTSQNRKILYVPSVPTLAVIHNIFINRVLSLIALELARQIYLGFTQIGAELIELQTVLRKLTKTR